MCLHFWTKLGWNQWEYIPGTCASEIGMCWSPALYVGWCRGGFTNKNGELPRHRISHEFCQWQGDILLVWLANLRVVSGHDKTPISSVALIHPPTHTPTLSLSHPCTHDDSIVVFERRLGKKINKLNCCSVMCKKKNNTKQRNILFVLLCVRKNVCVLYCILNIVKDTLWGKLKSKH
jgi:hypothetical protein